MSFSESTYDEIYCPKDIPNQQQFAISTHEFISRYESYRVNDFSEIKNEYEALQNVSVLLKAKQTQLMNEIQKLAKLQLNLHHQHFHVNQILISLSKSCFTNEHLKAIFISENENSSNYQYILCQDPSPSTIVDFMKMIFENEISLVILVSIKKKNKFNMFEYWPKKKEYNYTNSLFSVTEESVKRENNLIIRELTIKNTFGLKRRITQFHLEVSLKDKANLTKSYRNLIENIYVRKASGIKFRILFHTSETNLDECSNLMCVDKLISNLCDGIQEINVYQTVLELNQYERFSLKNESQYLFIYDCIYKFLEGSIKVITPQKRF